jgi:hypothetical protein
MSVVVFALAVAAYLYVNSVQAQAQNDRCLYHHCGAPMLVPSSRPPPSGTPLSR